MRRSAVIARLQARFGLGEKNTRGTFGGVGNQAEQALRACQGRLDCWQRRVTDNHAVQRNRTDAEGTQAAHAIVAWLRGVSGAMLEGSSAVVSHGNSPGMMRGRLLVFLTDRPNLIDHCAQLHADRRHALRRKGEHQHPDQGNSQRFAHRVRWGRRRDLRIILRFILLSIAENRLVLICLKVMVPARPKLRLSRAQPSSRAPGEKRPGMAMIGAHDAHTNHPPTLPARYCGLDQLPGGRLQPPAADPTGGKPGKDCFSHAASLPLKHEFCCQDELPTGHFAITFLLSPLYLNQLRVISPLLLYACDPRGTNEQRPQFFPEIPPQHEETANQQGIAEHLQNPVIRP